MLGPNELLSARGQGRWRGPLLAVLVAVGMLSPIAAQGLTPDVTSAARAAHSAHSAHAAHAARPASAAPCAAGVVCLDVDATHPVGPAMLMGQGFLHGGGTSEFPEHIAALHPTSWVIGNDPQAFVTARSDGAMITEVLSDLWYQLGPTNPVVPPWQDFTVYRAWVRQTVAQLIASGRAPDYWEVQNEPDGAYGTFPPATVAQSLEQYKIAATSIREADPTAKIVGPGMISPFYSYSRGLDIQTFITYVNANNLPLDALTWHEVGDSSWHKPGQTQPDQVIAHVATIRSYLAAYPRLANVPIFINEYAPSPVHLIPGWGVGYLAAVEASGAALASRSCWHEVNNVGRMVADCYGGSLDGLYQPGSGLPQDIYWVNQTYANMRGVKLATSSTDETVSAFSTLDSSAGALTVLLGRHVSCTAAVRTECNQSPAATPGAVPTVLHLTLPTSSSVAAVTILRIPNTPGPMLAPTIVTPLSVMSGSSLTIPIGGGTGGLVDGDAYVVILRLL